MFLQTLGNRLVDYRVMTHYLTVCVKPICHVRTYPEADVFGFLKDLDVYGHDQFVVAASGHSELHLVPKLEGLC